MPQKHPHRFASRKSTNFKSFSVIPFSGRRRRRIVSLRLELLPKGSEALIEHGIKDLFVEVFVWYVFVKFSVVFQVIDDPRFHPAIVDRLLRRFFPNKTYWVS